MARDNLINNCPVMLESIKVDNGVFGPDVASLQGKMVWHFPEHIDPTYVAIPPEIISCNLYVIAVVDLMFVNGLPLVSLNWNITLITVSYMPSCMIVDLWKGMMQIVLIYCWQELTVTTVMVNNQFDPL